MKRLMLIRHGKSSWTLDAIGDLLRPLNSRGYSNLDVMVGRNILRDNTPDHICCSHAVRAYSTALGLCHGLSITIDKLSICPWIYTAAANEFLSRMQSYWGDNELIWLIGHNPTLESLVAQLVPNCSVKMPTLCCVLLEYDETSGVWHLLDADCPKSNFVFSQVSE
ncbi:SixA phosphatase family protein [Corallincola spongiicola]|uniref:Histidine phosphatase family protein n=1 Tax=Corallincola spongiicola TaxID=2520508 RepID=A0ABY1WUT7_9GAMM|nr:histidine phosphatase family protein [Corallincola spongiicola]TAA48480.1 hypothetical protein EXY25_04460 [Corallincola spongiicola]